uniref:Uncharacterized protein n=1 Tax=Kalanchoe fedtschenkoi TaxID=63787 RepID=A0A7N0TDM6_KALFE
MPLQTWNDFKKKRKRHRRKNNVKQKNTAEHHCCLTSETLIPSLSIFTALHKVGCFLMEGLALSPETYGQCDSSTDKFYEQIEAPKFVDLTVKDPVRVDDRYWFCSRVGTTDVFFEVSGIRQFRAFANFKI